MIAWRPILPRFTREDGPMWAISIGHAFTHWYPGTFTLLLPFLARDLGLSFTQVGFLFSFRAWVGTFANLPGGVLVDLVGKRNAMMAISLAWAGVPYFFMGFSDRYLVMALCMALVGIGNQLWHPAALSTLSELYPRRRGFGIAIHALGANLGDTLAPLAAGTMLAWWSWRTVVFLNVVPGLLMALLLWALLRDAGAMRRQDLEQKKARLDAGGYWLGMRHLARNRNVLLVMLVSGMRSLTQNGLLTFLPLYLANDLRMPPAVAGLYIAIVQVSGLVASPLSGWLSDRFGRKPIVGGGTLTTGVLLLALAAFRQEWAFVLVLSLLGFFLFAVRPVLFAWAMDESPSELGGTVVGLLFGVQAAFSSIAPLVGGLLADRWGLLSAFYFLGISILLANAIVLLLRDSKRVAA